MSIRLLYFNLKLEYFVFLIGNQIRGFYNTKLLITNIKKILRNRYSIKKLLTIDKHSCKNYQTIDQN